MKLKTILAAVLFSLTFSTIAFADEASVKQELKAKFPDMPIVSVKKTNYGDLYEVFLGNQIVYTDEKISYFLVGNLIDIKSQRNVTQERMQDLTKVKFDSLPFDMAIKVVKGNGKRRIAVFEDPDCPYCKKLEHELASLTDYTKYVFLFPLDSLHPGASQKAAAVWCSKDRSKAWEDLMQNGVVPKAKTCDTPLAKLADLAKQLHIYGTPAVIFEDGRMVPGAIPAAQIDHLMGAVKK